MVANKKLRILISDDEAHIRMMLKGLVQSMNAEVVGEAENGEKAVEIFRQKHPHITLMDINMPVRNGLEALREMKAEKPDAFIIMMTSVDDTETVQACIDYGANSYILKNTPLMEMKQIIREAWNDYKDDIYGGKIDNHGKSI
jgi:two-component system chemotaxis response regulator CheY